MTVAYPPVFHHSLPEKPLTWHDFRDVMPREAKDLDRTLALKHGRDAVLAIDAIRPASPFAAKLTRAVEHVADAPRRDASEVESLMTCRLSDSDTTAAERRILEIELHRWQQARDARAAE